MSNTDASKYQPLLNTIFSITRSALLPENDASATPPEGITLELIKVEEDKRDTHDCLSLIFQGPATTCLPQKTYCVSSDKLEATNMFIVPIGAVRKNGKLIGYQYQTIFSKLNIE